MNKLNKKLQVYWERNHIGDLSLDHQNKFEFQYDKDWIQNPEAMPISLSLPLQEEPYTEDKPRPFFANLLPEAQVRRAITRELGISEENEFGLLEAIGGECAGALSLYSSKSLDGNPRKNLSENPFDKPASYQPISTDDIEQWMRKRPHSPLIRGIHEKSKIRLSLAGAQSKLPVYFEDEKLFIPRGSLSSTHILKPPIPEFKGSVENEAYCMALADHLKLGVANSFILESKTPLYLTLRYDRTMVESLSERFVKRHHQEDFCQALGVMPQNKYESEGGPSLANCFKILTEYSSQPLIDRLRLLKWVIFNQLIGNADAHAKNLSLLFVKRKVVLAPFYDLMCTRIYPALSSNAAMSIGNEKRLDWIWHRHWEQLSKDIEIKSSLVLKTVEEMAVTLPTDAAKVEKLFQTYPSAQPHLKQIRSLIESRCAKTLKRLKKSE